MKIAFTIFRKELRESLRDRRTLMMMVGLPIVLYPLLIIGMSKVQSSRQATSEARASIVAVWGELPTELRQRLEDDEQFELKIGEGLSDELSVGIAQGPPSSDSQDSKAATTEDESIENSESEDSFYQAARSVVLNREADAVLVAWGDLPATLERGALGQISIFFDSIRTDSWRARSRLADEILAYRDVIVGHREKQHALPAGFSDAIDVKRRDVASRVRRSGRALGTLLPLLIILISVMGGFYSAIDLTAGEKERGTMQTLLCAPVHSFEIILGKFLAVWTISLIASIANIASLAATFARVSIGAGTLEVAPINYVLSFVVLIPVSFMVAALFLAVAVFARDFKDGQNYLTPLLIVLILPLGVTIAAETELNAWTAFVPVVNISLLIRALFLGEAAADMAFLVMLSSTAYAVLALSFAAHVFQKESLLLGGRESFRGLFRIHRQPGAEATPNLAILLFAVTLVAAFYVGLATDRAGILVTILVVQGAFLVPNLATVIGFRFDLRSTLNLRLPPWRGVLAAVLIGLSAWAVAAGLILRLLPPPESVTRAMEKMLLLDDVLQPLWVVLLVLAVTPAICEELFFRGFCLSAFKRTGKWPALVVTALLFGLAHASIYRLLPTAFLGFVMGYAVWKTRSVATGMIVHVLNNGLLITLVYMPHLVPNLDLGELQALPWSITLAGAAVCAVGLLLLRTLPEP
jgi:sodium transport system permease protein